MDVSVTASDQDKFRFRRLNRPLNWDRLRAIDLERVSRKVDCATVMSCADDICFGDVIETDIDPSLHRTLNIAQFSAQYLLSCKNLLQSREAVLVDALRTFDKEEELLDLEIVKMRAREKALRRENRSLENIRSDYLELLVALDPKLAKKYRKSIRKQKSDTRDTNPSKETKENPERRQRSRTRQREADIRTELGEPLGGGLHAWKSQPVQVVLFDDTVSKPSVSAKNLEPDDDGISEFAEEAITQDHSSAVVIRQSSKKPMPNTNSSLLLHEQSKRIPERRNTADKLAHHSDKNAFEEDVQDGDRWNSRDSSLAIERAVKGWAGTKVSREAMNEVQPTTMRSSIALSNTAMSVDSLNISTKPGPGNGLATMEVQDYDDAVAEFEEIPAANRRTSTINLSKNSKGGPSAIPEGTATVAARAKKIPAKLPAEYRRSHGYNFDDDSDEENSSSAVNAKDGMGLEDVEDDLNTTIARDRDDAVNREVVANSAFPIVPPIQMPTPSARQTLNIQSDVIINSTDDNWGDSTTSRISRGVLDHHVLQEHDDVFERSWGPGPVRGVASANQGSAGSLEGSFHGLQDFEASTEIDTSQTVFIDPFAIDINAGGSMGSDANPPGGSASAGSFQNEKSPDPSGLRTDVIKFLSQQDAERSDMKPSFGATGTLRQQGRGIYAGRDDEGDDVLMGTSKFSSDMQKGTGASFSSTAETARFSDSDPGAAANRYADEDSLSGSFQNMIMKQTAGIETAAPVATTQHTKQEDGACWHQGRAPMDLVETARALDVFVSAIRLDWDANIGTTDIIYIQLELLGILSNLSAPISSRQAAVQPISFAAHLKSCPALNATLRKGIQDEGEYLSIHIHVLSNANSSSNIGMATVNIRVMLEDSCSILRQEADILTEDENLFGSAIVDVKGHRYLKSCE